MGQAKHNPVAFAAKKGELSPKPQKLSKRESERLLAAQIKIALSTQLRMPLEIIGRY